MSTISSLVALFTENSGQGPSVGFISQLVTMLFTFITRSLFIKYIGTELLGLNSTFSSVLVALSLAELGFQSAIIYNLYKPLHDNNREQINSIMNILKLIYRGIGAFFIVAVLLLTPFLKYIVTGIEITSTVYVYFWLQAMASVCSYFLAYKRAILCADQKEYISKTVDLICSIFYNVLQCVALVKLKSYVVYLALKVAQTFVSNVLIHVYCAKHYTYLHKVALDKAKFAEIFHDVRNIFASKIAGFIYSSTDNLVISAFVSTVSVGYFVNYTTITTSLKTLISSAISPVIPVLGNHLLDEQDSDNREKVFFLDTFVRYFIALMIVIPTGTLINDFIAWWVGKEMILSKGIVMLLCMDFYIHFVHSATVDFVNSVGLFKSDKYIEMLGAACNIGTSLLFVQYMGIEGVLVGTVISQVVFWIGRSMVVYRECLHLGMHNYLRYWVKNLWYIMVTIGLTFAVTFVYGKINIENLLMRFIIGGIVSEVIIVAVAVVIFWKSAEMKELRQILLKR